MTEDYTNLVIEEVNKSEPIRDNRLSLLESIDNLSYRTISFGFPLLTIGIMPVLFGQMKPGVHIGFGSKRNMGFNNGLFLLRIYTLVLLSRGKVKNQQLLLRLVFLLLFGSVT